jgi:hypothetical protein
MPRHSDVWGVELNISRLLTPALVWVECSTSRPCQFTVCIIWRGGQIGPSAGLQAVEKRGKKLHSCEEMHHDRPARRQLPDNVMCSMLTSCRMRKARNKLTEWRQDISVSTKLMLRSKFIVRHSIRKAKIHPLRRIMTPWILCQHMQDQHL